MVEGDLFSLKDKFILVTGGTRGIGRAITKRFAFAGAKVLANFVRNNETAESLVTEIRESGFSIDICRADLTRPNGMKKLVGKINDQELELSGIVHCAATGVHRKIEDLELRQFDWTFSLNVRAFLQLVSLLLPKLSSGASIVAISSAGAVRAAPTYSLVGASKGALESLIRHMAVELSENKIRANSISPGAVLTDAWDILPDREKRLEERKRRSPYHRLTTPEEVACAAQFLCSDASAGINGHTLVVDGGERIVE
jgi:enoyl-[acyl-carrier protein] reductase III